MPNSLARKFRAVEFQMAVLPESDFINDGVRVTKYQTKPCDELHTTFAAIFHPSVSPTIVVAIITLKQTRGSVSIITTTGIVPWGRTPRAAINHTAAPT